MAGLPKVSLNQVIYETERDVIAKAMRAVSLHRQAESADHKNSALAARLIDESNDADLALEDACSLLADLRGQPLTGGN